MGAYDKANQQFQQMADQSLAAYRDDPTNPDHQVRYSTALIALGDSQAFLKETRAALENYQKASQLRRELVQLDPENARFQEKYATSLSRVASAHELLQDTPAVFEPLREAVKLRKSLLEQEPDDRLRQRNLWIDLQSLGRAYLAAREFGEAEKMFQEHLKIARELTSKGIVESGDLNGLAQGHFHLGLIRFEELMGRLEDENVSFQLTMPQYQDVMTQLDTSLQTYQRMEQIAPLTKAESNFRKSVIETKKLIEEMAEKLVNSTGDDDGESAPSD